MEIEFFSDKNAAQQKYARMVWSGYKCALSGPCDSVDVPTSDPAKSYTYDANGKGEVYVVIIDLADTIASFDIKKSVPEKPKADG